MLKSFEPCKTKPVEYVPIFRDHILNTLKRPPQDWQKVEPTFAKMTALASGFNWALLTKSELFNQPEVRTIQDNMEEYIRYVAAHPDCVC